VRARPAVAATLGVALGALALTVWGSTRILRKLGIRSDHLSHIPLPRLTAARVDPGGATVPTVGAPGPAMQLAEVPGRVTSLLAIPGGAIWVGTFDRGVHVIPRHGAGEAPASAAGQGSPFVNGLAWFRDEVVVATSSGAERHAPSGAMLGRYVTDAAVTVALAHRGRLYLGTPHGVAIVEGDRLRVVESPGVHTLAASGGAIWLGTASGVCAFPHLSPPQPVPERATSRQGATGAPACRTLLFGRRALGSTWINALAGTPGGLFAFTDTGGAAIFEPPMKAPAQVAGTRHPRTDGGVAAGGARWRFQDARLDWFEPGAAVALPDGRVAAATQGAGLLLLEPGGEAVWWEDGPRDVTALALDREGNLILGTQSGRVARVSLPVVSPFARGGW
jgi:hypothetical protein